MTLGPPDAEHAPTRTRRGILSARRPWLWIVLAVGLLVVAALLRELLVALGALDLTTVENPPWAYVTVALLVFADGVCAIFPAETTLNTASALAVDGSLDLGLIMLAGAVGAITGDSALYWLARLSRRRFQARLEAAMRHAKVAEAMDLIGSSAPVMLCVGRFVPGLRFVVNASCGLTSYPYGSFLLWSAIGGTTWSVVTCLTAYSLGTALGDDPLLAIVLASLVSTFAIAFLFVFIRRRRAARAAAVRTTAPRRPATGTTPAE